MIFRRLILVLKWFRLKIMNNHTLIIENLLGMYGMGNWKLSSWIFEEYLFLFFHFISVCFHVLKVRFPPIPCRGLLWFQNQNKSLHMPKNTQLIIDLKNSIQFNSLFWIEANWSAVRKWRKLKVEIQWVKISISEATH